MNGFFWCLECLDLSLVTSVCEIGSFFVSVIGLFLVSNVYSNTIEINKNIKITNDFNQDCKINGSGNIVNQSFVVEPSIKNEFFDIGKK